MTDDLQGTSAEERLPVGLTARQDEIVGERQPRYGGMPMALFRYETGPHQPARIDVPRADRPLAYLDGVVVSHRILA